MRDTRYNPTPGDTYAAYCNRCFLRGLRPMNFETWLAYELNRKKWQDRKLEDLIPAR